MLPAAQRLRRRAEFAATIRLGRRAGRGPLVIHLASETPSPTVGGDSKETPVARVCARVGFVVPKVVGTAVERNRVRRRLRHLLRTRLAALPPGSSMVVRVLSGGAALSAAELAELLDQAIARASSTSTGGRRQGLAARESSRSRRPARVEP